MTNKEYLICIDEKLNELKEQFNNHLKHHFAVSIALLTITGGAITALILANISFMSQPPLSDAAPLP